MTNDLDLKDVIKAEWIRCTNDPIYFFKKYCWIQTNTGGKIKFNTWPFQEKVLDEMINHSYNIILKSRQLGISQLCAMVALHHMIFYSDKFVLVIATKQDVAKNLVKRVTYTYDKLPNWIKSHTQSVEKNKLSLALSNGSSIKAVSSSGDSGRSESISMLIVDEAAFIENMEEIWTSIQPTLPGNASGKCTVLSTPNGTSNWYYKEWVKAKQGIGEFYPIRLHWSMRPDRDQAWRDAQDILLGERKASQECDANFLTSGNTLIDSAIIQHYFDEVVQAPVEKRAPFLNLGIKDDSFWIWKYPVENKTYIISADVARGNGSDFSTCHVFEVDTLIQCAEFKGQVDTTEFGKFLVMVANMYNQGLLVPENNNSGWSTIQTIVSLYYPNLYYTSDKNLVIYPDKIYTNKLNAQKNKAVPGFGTTSANRMPMMNKLYNYFKEKGIVIYSERTMYEIQSFIWRGDRPEAANGYNDDLVMALAILLWVRDTSMELLKAGSFRTQALIDNSFVLVGELDTSNLPIGYMTDLEPYKMKISPTSDEYEDLSDWI